MPTDTPFGILEAAARTLEQERRELVAEQQAFERFGDRVAELEADGLPAGESAAPTRASGSVLSHASARPGLSRVKKAYERTVMAAAHYSRTYEETPIESMAAELSGEVASAVERESTLHPPLKRSLIDTAEHAARSRGDIVEEIEREREAIETAESDLTSLLAELDSLLRQPIARMECNALRLTGERLRALREQCDALAVERQRQLRRRGEGPTADDGLFERYWYGECEHTYPILAAIGRFGALLDDAVRYVDRRLVECA